ncbi:MULTISPECIES: DUF2652 domain-containing protein [unclassified Leeuwenhoekiella]|uniref:DUF2652 domain-containing protein n=1 Tax=unclassified Leeuwenhoekiella TaxID=2615029 RepID=UPI000C4ACB51|nr:MULTISPECIES: DUF2652 domain-containing protein [unclassified Leeuwenhoekiella]MAW94168.1 hypothetical protein [Leeuwenhoekiella sp.]MAW96222.1 hypothetical protein [Leeuwenhoekiella sp.]MBA80216.1 hypothetical protein [Leeuwenhoekiella sp.]|tara:strand:- start:6149 stop:6748 length:600 start_codon:yes stop_codon:yes gene_type:complete
MKAEPTLICIPDISGFTQFMREANFDLSAQVIPALLNEIIYANTINLQVSEIEGDAILFFRSGELPALEELIDQCKAFYKDFYTRIDKLYKEHKKEDDARSISDILGLKIILHYGEEIAMVPIGNRIKLMGEDVITAHRMLKNNIPIDEYIAISEQVYSKFDTDEFTKVCNWSEIHEGHLDIEHLGVLNYRYIDLEPLN